MKRALIVLLLLIANAVVSSRTGAPANMPPQVGTSLCGVRDASSLLQTAAPEIARAMPETLAPDGAARRPYHL
jgi:hypothetical protein